MTYLHDFTKARETLREKVIPKMIAALMPTLDFLGYSYERQEDSLLVTLPEGTLPEGYIMLINFVPGKPSAWKTADGTDTKGPGF